VSVFLLVVYAAGIWGLRDWARPMAWLYAAYVTTNVLLFPFRTPQPPDAGLGYWAFGLIYTVLAMGGSIGGAVLLGRRRTYDEKTRSRRVGTDGCGRSLSVNSPTAARLDTSRREKAASRDSAGTGDGEPGGKPAPRACSGARPPGGHR
jgi:hypothetical protein